MGGAIRLGDSHSGGGTMSEASGLPVDGIAQCLLGDKADCPTHKGSFPLVSGGEGSAVHNGRPMIFAPATLSCGCRVSSTCGGHYDKSL